MCYLRGNNMKKYENSIIVKTDDLNHHGTLFIGKALTYLAETGFLNMALTYGNGDEIVFRALDGFRFFSPVPKGSILTYTSQIVRLGKTSATLYIKGECKLASTLNMEGYCTYVTVDEKTRVKKPHNMVLDSPSDEYEKELRQKADEFFKKLL